MESIVEKILKGILMKKMMTFIVGLTVLLLSLTEFADAIPAFARKYDMSCNTCHSPVPKLKPFGEEFMNNGYQLPGQEPPRYYKETGDDKLLLMRELPLAVRIDGFAMLEQNGGTKLDMQAPVIAKLLSGGQIAKNVSYYFYFLMSEAGEIVGPEDAFLTFGDVFKSGIDITVGQFQVSDPLFKRELRLTREDYQIYNTPVGNSSASLTYDRGLMIGYSLPSKTDFIFEILNGNGIGSAGSNGFLDNDKNKNFMLRVSQEVNENIRMGIFGYTGKEDQNDSTNTTFIFGPDVTLTLSKFQMNMQYVHREDDNPYFTQPTTKVNMDGAFAELIYSPDGDKSDWYGVAIYNWVNSKTPGLTYQSATVSGHYMLARNLRLVGEYTYDIEHTANRISVGFVAAF
jgi:hypothetical protein